MKRALLLATVLVFGSLFLQACQVSTTEVTDVKICDNMTEDQCDADMQIVSATAPAIYCSGQLENAPEGTTLKITWRYLTNDQDIDSVTLTAEKSGGGPFSSSLTKPDSGWPSGKYEVVLDLGTDNSEPIHKQFEIM